MCNFLANRKLKKNSEKLYTYLLSKKLYMTEMHSLHLLEIKNLVTSILLSISNTLLSRRDLHQHNYTHGVRTILRIATASELYGPNFSLTVIVRNSKYISLI